MLNDSRFWKTFRTKHKVNANAPSAPYVQGDLGIMYVINQPGDTRFSANVLNNSCCYTVQQEKLFPMCMWHIKMVLQPMVDGTDTRRFPSLSKFMDGSRTAWF